MYEIDDMGIAASDKFTSLCDIAIADPYISPLEYGAGALKQLQPNKILPSTSVFPCQVTVMVSPTDLTRV